MLSYHWRSLKNLLSYHSNEFLGRMSSFRRCWGGHWNESWLYFSTGKTLKVCLLYPISHLIIFFFNFCCAFPADQSFLGSCCAVPPGYAGVSHPCGAAPSGTSLLSMFHNPFSRPCGEGLGFVPGCLGNCCSGVWLGDPRVSPFTILYV